MTTYTWNSLDPAKAKPGDVIVNDSLVEYIESVREIPKNIPNLIRPEYLIELTRYTHEFGWSKEPGAGFSFDCFEDGSLPNSVVIHHGITREQYFEQVKNTPPSPKFGELIYKGITVWRKRRIREAAVIRCIGSVTLRRGTKIIGYEECGEEISLDMVMTNTCPECGSDYNVSGQKLAPRSQWGWDTGESLSDILNSDWSINDPTPGREIYGEDW